jgi:hypothetical protein
MNETLVQSPGLRKCTANREISFSRPRFEDLCNKFTSMHLSFGRSEMGAGRGHGYRATQESAIAQFASNSSSVWVTNSDTIWSDSRVPFIPIWEGRPQTEHAAPRSTPIPCFRRPRSKQFPFWFQPVDAVSAARLRPLNSDYARPEKARSKMATSGQVSSRLYGLPTGISQTEDAAFMANPEV